MFTLFPSCVYIIDLLRVDSLCDTEEHQDLFWSVHISKCTVMNREDERRNQPIRLGSGHFQEVVPLRLLSRLWRLCVGFLVTWFSLRLLQAACWGCTITDLLNVYSHVYSYCTLFFYFTFCVSESQNDGTCCWFSVTLTLVLCVLGGDSDENVPVWLLRQH